MQRFFSLVKQAAASSNAFEIEEATIRDLQRAMERDELSASALVTYYQERIEQFDQQLNAIIAVDPEASTAAARLDEERANGQLRGPLHGIPIIVKDNIDTAGLPTTGGCRALATLQPPDDAFAIAQLRAAGGIVLAKANLHELALSGETASGLGGQTRNPYNLSYTPGGSSGGTAAALAANFGAVGLGSDTFNSARSPASACNIVGLRPTAGLVSRDGLMPVALSQDAICPMGRTVADVAALLEAIATDDPADPMTARSAGQPAGSYRPFLKKGGLKGLRLGIARSLFGRGKAHRAVNQLMDAAIATLRALGAQCVDIPIQIDMNRLIDELSVSLWEGKLHFEQYLASAGKAAPVNTLSALIKTGQIHPSIEPLLEKLQAIESPLGDGEYWQRLYPRRAALRQHLTRLFQQQQLDAIVYPHQQQLVAAIGEEQQARNGFLAAASGFPAIAVPAGFASEAGLPVGIEFMAEPFQEARLLQVAYAYEQKTHWRRKPDLSR